MDKSPNPAEKTLSAQMAEKAEIALCLPESLVWDAWDIAVQSGRDGVNRAYWTECLKLAIARYDADPINYVYNAQISPEGI